VVRVRRLMTIKNMTLTAMPKSTLMTAQLSIEVYYQPYPATIGKATDPIEPFSQKEMSTLDTIASYPVVFTPETQPVSVQEPSLVGEEPTTLSVVDPFSAPSSQTTFIPTSTPTPSPLVSPTVSLVPTKTPTPSLP